MTKLKAILPVFLLTLLVALSGCSEKVLPSSDGSGISDASGEETLASEESLASEPETAEPASDSEDEATVSRPSAQASSGGPRQFSAQGGGSGTSKSESRQSTPAKESSKETSKVPSTPSEQETITCTFSIDCKNAIGKLPPNLVAILPSDGMILKSTTVTCKKNETVLAVLKRICKEKNIAIESDFSGYVRGIAQLYQKDCGDNSGWMYSVNGTFPNIGAGAYRLKEGDVVVWRYTCEYGDTMS